MRCLLLLPTVLWLGLFGSAAAADDGGDIRQVIPADAAMMRADFERLATDQSGPSASKVEDKSLTLMLLDLRVKDDEKSKEQFRFLTDRYPKPSTLARELHRERRTGERRILLGPVTFIHADRITDFKCKVNGDTAAGTVSFKVPELYQGQVEYVAQKLGGKWFISEFIMPAYRIHVVRGDDGLWKQKH
jgi:hypothetical protein